LINFYSFHDTIFPGIFLISSEKHGMGLLGGKSANILQVVFFFEVVTYQKGPLSELQNSREQMKVTGSSITFSLTLQPAFMK
jgi:hypothetical protein